MRTLSTIKEIHEQKFALYHVPLYYKNPSPVILNVLILIFSFNRTFRETLVLCNSLYKTSNNIIHTTSSLLKKLELEPEFQKGGPEAQIQNSGNRQYIFFYKVGTHSKLHQFLFSYYQENLFTYVTRLVSVNICICDSCTKVNLLCPLKKKPWNFKVVIYTWPLRHNFFVGNSPEFLNKWPASYAFMINIHIYKETQKLHLKS